LEESIKEKVKQWRESIKEKVSKLKVAKLRKKNQLLKLKREN